MSESVLGSLNVISALRNAGLQLGETFGPTQPVGVFQLARRDSIACSAGFSSVGT